MSPTGHGHTSFPHEGEEGAEVEAHLVDAESGTETGFDAEEDEATRANREGAAKGARVDPSIAAAYGIDAAHRATPWRPTEAKKVPVKAGKGAKPADAARGAEEPPDLVGALDQIAAERDEYLESLRRLQADFENYRKRVMKEQADARERGAESLVEKLLPVLDTVDLAFAHASDPDQAVEGIHQIGVALTDALSKQGMERIWPVGEPFDPSVHEAVAHEPAGGDGGAAGEADHEGPAVSEVMRAGYLWKGRVIRPAMVKVRG